MVALDGALHLLDGGQEAVVAFLEALQGAGGRAGFVAEAAVLDFLEGGIEALPDFVAVLAHQLAFTKLALELDQVLPQTLQTQPLVDFVLDVGDGLLEFLEDFPGLGLQFGVGFAAQLLHAGEQGVGFLAQGVEVLAEEVALAHLGLHFFPELFEAFPLLGVEVRQLVHARAQLLHLLLEDFFELVGQDDEVPLGAGLSQQAVLVGFQLFGQQGLGDAQGPFPVAVFGREVNVLRLVAPFAGQLLGEGFGGHVFGESPDVHLVFVGVQSRSNQNAFVIFVLPPKDNAGSHVVSSSLVRLNEPQPEHRPAGG